MAGTLSVAIGDIYQGFSSANSGNGSLYVNAVRQYARSVALTGSGQVAATTTGEQYSRAPALAGSGTASTSQYPRYATPGSESGAGTFAGTAFPRFLRDAALAGGGTLTAEAYNVQTDFFDDFERADGGLGSDWMATSIVVNTPSAYNWRSNTPGRLSISSGKAVAPAATFSVDMFAHEVTSTDMEVTITMGSTSADAGLTAEDGLYVLLRSDNHDTILAHMRYIDATSITWDIAPLAYSSSSSGWIYGYGSTGWTNAGDGGIAMSGFDYLFRRSGGYQVGTEFTFRVITYASGTTEYRVMRDGDMFALWRDTHATGSYQQAVMNADHNLAGIGIYNANAGAIKIAAVAIRDMTGQADTFIHQNVYTSNSYLTSPIPQNVAGCYVTMIGQGGGGGSGRRGNASTNKCGGSGGGAGAYIPRQFIPIGDFDGDKYEVRWPYTLASGGIGPDTSQTGGGGGGTGSYVHLYDVGAGIYDRLMYAPGGSGGVGGGTGESTGGDVAYQSCLFDAKLSRTYTSYPSWLSKGTSLGNGKAAGAFGVKPGPGGGGGGVNSSNTKGVGAAGASNDYGSGGAGGDNSASKGQTGTVATLATPVPGTGAGGGGHNGNIGDYAGDAKGFGAGGGGSGATAADAVVRNGGKGGPAFLCVEWVAAE